MGIIRYEMRKYKKDKGVIFCEMLEGIIGKSLSILC